MAAADIVRSDYPKSPKFLDLRGQRFGRLVVEAYYGSSPHGRFRRHYWQCLCDCGKSALKEVSALRQAGIQSCGCKRSEMAAQRQFKHGQSGSKGGRGRRAEYTAWLHMKARCGKPENRSFKDYGARGIAVCDRWLNDFEAFYQDVGPKPSLLHSIDRIDVNGPYSPENCRWATPVEQASNTRRTRVVTFQGERMTLAEAIRRSGLTRAAVENRLRDPRWTVERALTEPMRWRKAKD